MLLVAAAVQDLQGLAEKKEPGARQARYSDRTVNRVLAHLETFAKWIHKLIPFSLENPWPKSI